MKTFYLTIIGILISGMSYSQLAVKKVTSEVALDGIPEESFWDVSTQITLGSSNNTANFGLLWDDNYLYVGVNVEDATLCTNKRQGFYDDGIEICIDGNNNQGTSFDNYDRIFIKPIRSYWIQEMEQRYTGLIHKCIENANGYTMEFAIPWTNFNITPSTGTNIGFNIIVNDDENCDSQSNIIKQLLWAGNSTYYNNSSIWGTISLSSETVSYTTDYITLLSPNGGDFYINNKITDINWVSNGIANVDIDYSSDNGSTWNSAAANISASSGLYNWNVSATPSDNCLIRISEAGNKSLNDISESVFTISAPLTAVEPLIPNVWKNYEWPYNAYFPENPNGINGHIGSACGHASLARILHYWEFPIVGNDELTFTDNGGNIWSANFGATIYNYDNMPNYLPPSSTEPEYTDVAKLTYHAATSMHDIYGSGGNLDKMSYAMSHYFNYKVSTPTIRSAYTKAEWMNILINELDNGRVLLIDGMTTEVLGDWHENNWIAGHWFHIDGYNEDGHFHGVLGFSNEDAWFDIDNLFGYYLNNGILVGLEPNLNGKELSLQTHNGGEIIQAGQVSQINWSSTVISNIRIEYTADNGQSWTEIIATIPASTGSYNWTLPEIDSDKCKIKLTDVSDVNVYVKSESAFSIQPYDLTINTPVGGNYYIPGTSTTITWKSTPVSNIKIEYTSDNGDNWTEIAANIDASLGSYNWIIPNTISSQCKIKITDITNTAVFNESVNPFEIGSANNAGGPYAVDDNTVVLLHFEGDLINQSPLSDDGIQQGTGNSYGQDTPLNKGLSLNIDGSLYIAVPHNDNLNLSENWTIEAWIKLTEYRGYPNDPYILRKPGDTDNYCANYAIGVVEAWGNIFHGFYFPVDNLRLNVTNITTELNQWYHVAFIRDVTNSSISITVRDENWEIVSSTSNTFTDNNVLFNTQDIRIGENFNGYIDELRISNIVRNFENTGTGISENTLGDLISMYPNPASNTIFISSPNVIDLSILNVAGQKVIEKRNFLNENIDVSTLKKGIYVVTFVSKKEIASKKLIIK